MNQKQPASHIKGGYFLLNNFSIGNKLNSSDIAEKK